MATNRSFKKPDITVRGAVIVSTAGPNMAAGQTYDNGNPKDHRLYDFEKPKKDGGVLEGSCKYVVKGYSGQERALLEKGEVVTLNGTWAVDSAGNRLLNDKGKPYLWFDVCLLREASDAEDFFAEVGD